MSTVLIGNPEEVDAGERITQDHIANVLKKD